MCQSQCAPCFLCKNMKRKSKWPTQKKVIFQNRQFSKFFRENFSDWSLQGAHYELTNIFLFFEIYNVNYKGEVRTRYLSFREKNNFYSLCLSHLSLLRTDHTERGNSWAAPSAPLQTAECSFRAIDCGVSSSGIKVNNQIGFCLK